MRSLWGGFLRLVGCGANNSIGQHLQRLYLNSILTGQAICAHKQSLAKFILGAQIARGGSFGVLSRTSGGMNFGSDPAYQVALEAAARSSVLAVTFGLPTVSPITQTPGTLLQPPNSTRQLSTNAAAPPRSSTQRNKPSAPRSGTEASEVAGSATAMPTETTASPTAKHTPQARGPGGGPTGRGRATSDGPGRERSSAGARQMVREQHPSGSTRGAGSGSESGSEARATAEAAMSQLRLDCTGEKEVVSGASEKSVKKRASEANGAKKDNSWFGVYPEHMPQQDLSTGLKSGQIFRGKIRINPGNANESYVTVPGLPHDLLIRGEINRNRAVEGDEVAVKVQPPSAWFIRNKVAKQQNQQQVAADPQTLRGPEECPWQDCTSPEQVKQVLCELLAAKPELRATAKVTGILTPSAKRDHLVGLLRLVGRLPDPALPSWDPATEATMPRPLSAAVEDALAVDAVGEPADEGRAHFHLIPIDPRLPICRVRVGQVYNMSAALLAGLLRGEPAAGRTLVSGLVRYWNPNSLHPVATLRASLGQAGEIESETAAILEAEAIRSGEFESDVLACLPPLPWRISEQDLVGRKDFRSHRVFSIDPPTAKDLDDALSIEPLPGGDGWRVGVHIADVSHFIEPFSALDVEAGRRATSTYMVQRVIPMLPPLLCEQLCSLNPGEDRLTFSVVWDMGKDGSIRSTWFGRSVIRSCAKLSYPLVQRMIEGDFRAEDTGVRLHGDGVTWDQVEADSLALWSLAKQLRAARFAGGALRLDNTRLFFSLDNDGNPVAAAPYVQKEANQLVEEFMVRANISVAQFVSGVFPDRAMLRRHPPPNENKMDELRDAAQAAGAQLDVSSAASLQASLAALRAREPPEVEGQCAVERLSSAARYRRIVDLVIMLATRPMQLAKYFSTGDCEDALELWRHYALAVDHYTHFTSPIRRYPDVVVHRQLAAALDVKEKGLSPLAAAAKHRLLDPSLTSRVADHCNERRLAARDAQDASLRLYLCVLLARQPCVALGTVNILGGDLFFSAYLTEFGTEVTVRIKEMGVPLTAEWNQGAKVLTLARQSKAGAEAGATPIGRERQGQAAGRGRGRGQDQGQGPSSAADGSGEGGTASLAEWVDSLPPVRNLHGLQPARLPLHLRQFDDVPLIMTAVLAAGEPPRLTARVYLPEAEQALAAKSARAGESVVAAKAQGSGKEAAAAADGTDVGTAVRQSMVPWDNMLVD
ncbi:hypothetical protein VaNZ11_014144 [Volvox africanus]|uniref:RNB domain-containing protein n=1 Tax=Volvox africanus TaxID=51714 RepID=A0ABQ5SIB5_9CHLO|nr:hypothetical protein VaNZ11_014144 [Volvox africanus]